MPVQPGSRLGPYEVVSTLGAGGMGEVYRARDTKLGRDVALKVISQSFTSDPERVARFEREAQLLASLNHPHIAAIYGFEDSGDTRALVLELVDGPTLADRIAQGPLPLDEALTIARQIAEALEAAHDKGIIHRDLKPANVKLTPQGKVKVLDFGLAKLNDPHVSKAPHDPSALSMSPTLMSPALMTGVGMILGTAAYMSPEQARGKTVDRRADIWAFGCVLFEMLTGKQTFVPGDTVSDAIAAVLTREPEWTTLPAATPARVVRLIRRCLQKDSEKRLPHIAIARYDLDEAPDDTPALPAGGPVRWPWVAAIAVLAAALTGALAAVGVWRMGSRTADAEMRVDIVTPPVASLVSLALSPDGRSIAYAAVDAGQPRLWVRSLDSTQARALPGTEQAEYPFWSPDSRSIGFFAEGQLKRIDLDAGAPRVLAAAAAGRGGTWNAAGVILFAPTPGAPLSRVSADGGVPGEVTRIEPGQAGHRLPQFLPDGRRFVYYASGGAEVRGVYLSDLDAAETHRLLDADAAATFHPAGYLMFVRGGTLLAQRIDVDAARLVGTPVRVAENVAADSVLSMAALSVSAAGSIAYRVGASDRAAQQFIWFDRTGRQLAAVGHPDRTLGWSPSLSPDGRQVAVLRDVDGNQDVWTLDLARGVLTRLTSHPANDIYGIWSPDGTRVAFGSTRAGNLDVHIRTLSTGGEEPLVQLSGLEVPQDWSLDGRYILYRTSDVKTGQDLWAIPVAGDSQPIPIARAPFEERGGQFSPDVAWVAYASNESGRFEIYVQPFPGPGRKVLVSTAGGGQPRWRRDGRELFYVALDGRLMAVPFRVADGTIEADAPVPLFPVRVPEAIPSVFGAQYVVAADGQRFLVNTVLGELAGGTPITLVLNWVPPE